MTKKERQAAFIEAQINNLQAMALKFGMITHTKEEGRDYFNLSSKEALKYHVDISANPNTNSENGQRSIAETLYFNIQSFTLNAVYYFDPIYTVKSLTDGKTFDLWLTVFSNELTNYYYLNHDISAEEVEKIDTDDIVKEALQDYKKNFLKSLFVKVLGVLEPLKEEYTDTEPADSYTLKNFTALYFFAYNHAISQEGGFDGHYLENRPLPKEQKEKVIKIYTALNAFFSDYEGDREKGYIEFIRRLFFELFRESAPPEIKTYTKILQGKPLNALAHTSKKNMLYHKPSNKGRILTQNEVQIFLDTFNSVDLKVTTHQVLDTLVIKITDGFPREEEGVSVSLEELDACREVSLSVDEYATLRNINDKKEARKQLNEAMQTLYNLSLEWDDTFFAIPEGKKRKTKITEHNKTRIIDYMGESLTANPIQNGIARAKFTMDIAKYLSRAQIMPYPNKIMTINPKKNPHSYYLARRLAEHHNMNIADKNSNTISVKKLIEALPDLPKYQTVMNKSRQVGNKIIEPFERDLDALCNYGILERWEYCNPKGVKLTEKQLSNYSYNDWINWMINFELKEYPDQSKRIKAIETARETAKRRKTRRNRQNKTE